MLNSYLNLTMFPAEILVRNRGVHPLKCRYGVLPAHTLTAERQSLTLGFLEGDTRGPGGGVRLWMVLAG